MTHLVIETERAVDAPPLNNQIAEQVLCEVLKKGVREFCVCPGARNAPFIYALAQAPQLKVYYWPEERSAAFFALGRMKATERPVAVVTTSGTAVGELLPAAMEAHYVNLPLVLITADRPRRLRTTGAPQTAEQPGLFGCYAHFSQDLDGSDEACNLDGWDYQGPVHLNVCFEEPKDSDCQRVVVEEEVGDFNKPFCPLKERDLHRFKTFLEEVKYPFVIVSALNIADRELAVQFLITLNAPLYLEAPSGIREDPRLAHLRLTCADQLWLKASKEGYPIDGVLRLGGIPTARLWRDLEDFKEEMQVCSVSDHPFPGVSGREMIHCSLRDFFQRAMPIRSYPSELSKAWLRADHFLRQHINQLFEEEPLAEASLFYQLSNKLPKGACIYLGNSLPIREWDLAATYNPRYYSIYASRGLNGIDGQLSTFLGLTDANQANWAVFGDLTTLYDLVAPWILDQLSDRTVNLVIINNGGGQLFSRMFSHQAFLHCHQLNFYHLAKFWGLEYERWTQIPETITPCSTHRLIEIVPDPKATDRFWKRKRQWEHTL